MCPCENVVCLCMRLGADSQESMRLESRRKNDIFTICVSLGFEPWVNIL